MFVARPGQRLETASFAIKASDHDSTPRVKLPDMHLVLVPGYISPMAGDGCEVGETIPAREGLNIRLT